MGRLLALIDASTRKRMADIIAKGLKNGLGPRAIMDEIRTYLNGELAGAERARQIAETEALNALHYGAFTASHAAGATHKYWVTAHDVRVCCDYLANEAQGLIPIRDPFRSGHMCPLAHPLCRCCVNHLKVPLGQGAGRRR